ncbi:MAG: hypothetical protein NC911_02895 [Candidatus Omnitrophica bacterium]|nr:hypothetical protein [Candidatus Omnitrophota bacterium]
MKPGLRTKLASLLILAQASWVYPWFVASHIQLTGQAVRMVAGLLPEFFRQGEKTISHTSQDPDILTEVFTRALVTREKPDHYFDSEYLKGETLPLTRYEYYRLLHRKGLDPQVVGCLPYAIWEWTEKLTGAFAQFRRWPESKEIQTKCLLYAGILAHYVQDGCMPLHVTLHYDGQMKDGLSPRTGLHQKMDGLFQLVRLDTEKIAAGLKVKPSVDLYNLVLQKLKESQSLVEEVYRLETELMAEEKSSRVISLAEKCYQNALSFTATVFLTAWESSARARIPDWVEP